MKKPIFERIIIEAEKEAAEIIAAAKSESKRVLSEGKAAIIEHNTAELEKAKERNTARVKNFADRQEKGLTTYQEQVRQELVVDVFAEVLAKLQALEGKELLAFVGSLLSKENIKGDEVILVSALNYKKYLAAFSSAKDGKKLDLLNKLDSKYQFTLSSEKTHIEEGFLLSSPLYDLIFDFKEIVAEYQKENEQRIYNELFKDE